MTATSGTVGSRCVAEWFKDPAGWILDPALSVPAIRLVSASARLAVCGRLAALAAPIVRLTLSPFGARGLAQDWCRKPP